MKVVSWVLLVCGLGVLLNGVVAFFLRYNFVTQERYGASLEPLIIMGAGMGILVVWLGLRTVVK